MTNTTLEKWEEKTLHEVLNKVKYTSKIQSKLYKDKGKYPIISQEDVFISGYWDNPSDVYHVKHPIVIFGDHTKVVKYIDFDFVLGADGVKILDPTKDINAKFLYYWTKYVPLRNLGYARHYKLLSEKTIHFPPLPEQERIVAKLDKAFEAIDKVKANAEQNLNNAKELFESALDKAFTENTEGWEEKTINDVCIVERGSSPRPIKNFITSDDSGVNWIKIGDCSGKYVTNTAQKITIEGAKKSRAVKVGDFIISNSMSYGKPYILKIDGFIHDGWFVLRLDKNLVNTDYFYHLLSSNYIREQYDALATGAIVQNISSDLIKKVKFLLPPLPEQERIVAKLDKLQEQTKQFEAIYTQKIKECDELKQSILQKAFRGEL